MVRRVILLWTVVLILGTGLVIQNILRTNRLADPAGGSTSYNAWDDFPVLFLIVVAICAVLCVASLFQLAFTKVNSRRISRELRGGEAIFVRGVRNFQTSSTHSGPLEGVAGMSAFSTVLVASAQGLALASGFRSCKVRVRFDWGVVEDISAVDLNEAVHKVRGNGISIQLQGFEMPLTFALVSETLPWIEMAPRSYVEDTVEQLRKLREANPGIKQNRPSGVEDSQPEEEDQIAGESPSKRE